MEHFGRYAIAAAPEAKIFQPHLQDKLLEDPRQIFEETEETIYVERASGRLSFVLGRPRAFIRPQSTDRCEDTNFLVEWLTGGDDGGQCQETEVYGIVKLRYDEHVERSITEAFFGAASGKKIDLPMDVTRARDAEMESAKRRSRERVMRAVRRVYENMKRQQEMNREGGMGQIQPSKVELLCNYVLKHEIAAEKARQEKITREIEETLAADPFAVDNVMTGVTTQERPVRRRRRKADGVQSDEIRADEPIDGRSDVHE